MSRLRLAWGVVKNVRAGLAGAWLGVVRHFPGVLGRRLRFLYYSRRMGALGEGTTIDENVYIEGAEHIFIGRGCWIGVNTVIAAGPPVEGERNVIRRPNPDFEHREGELHLGDHVAIAPGCQIIAHAGLVLEDHVGVSSGAKLYTTTLHYTDEGGERGEVKYGSGHPSDREGEHSIIVSPIVVLADSLVGTGGIVLPGVMMGPRTWLGAGALARKRLEPGRVYKAKGIEGQL